MQPYLSSDSRLATLLRVAGKVTGKLNHCFIAVGNSTDSIDRRAEEDNQEHRCNSHFVLCVHEGGQATKLSASEGGPLIKQGLFALGRVQAQIRKTRK